MDHHIGKLLKELKSCNLYENSLIIVTADHGELLGEHGHLGHGYYLYQPELHVPLLLKYPGKEVSPNRTDLPVQLTDIVPMILDRLGIKKPVGIQGEVPSQKERRLLAEVYPPPELTQKGHWRAIFERNFKFHWNSKGQHLLFNLKEDPVEKFNLIDYESARAERMMAKLNQHLASLPKPGIAGPRQELDNETKEALKSLGYVK